MFSLQLEHTLIHLFTQELEAVHQRDFVIIWILENCTVLLILQSIRLIQQTRMLDIYPCKLCKLTRLEFVGQHMPLGFGVRKPRAY